jgi:hypothetical protein
MRARLSRILPWLALPALPVAVAIGFWGFSYDDAFITYRYARNWAEGAGLTYNPGETVLGTTAPGWALLLGLLSRVTRLAVPAWGTLLSLAALTGCALLLGRALFPEKGRSFQFAFLFLGLAVTLRWNVEMLGAETFGVAFCGIAAAFLAFRPVSGRPVWAGALAATAAAFRPDAVLLGGALGLTLWIDRRRFPLRYAAALLGGLGLWLGWLQFRFGTVVPNTLAGKQAELARVVRGYSLSEWLWLRRGLPLASILVLLALAALGLWLGRERLRQPFALALGLWLATLEIAYRLLGVPFAPWYPVPALLGILALATLAAMHLGRRAGFAALLLLPVALPSWLWIHGQWGRPPDPRFRLYASLGRYLERTSPPGAKVASVEIGVLGYFSRRPVLDLAGLVSPEVLHAGRNGGLAELVARVQPAFLVDAPIFRAGWLNPILAHPEIARRYRPVATFSDPAYSGGRVRLLSWLPPPRARSAAPQLEGLRPSATIFSSSTSRCRSPLGWTSSRENGSNSNGLMIRP